MQCPHTRSGRAGGACGQPGGARLAGPDGGSGSVLEAPALVAGFDDVTVMGQAIEQRGGHLGVAEDARPFGEAEVGGHHHRGALVQLADQMEQQLAAGLGEGQGPASASAAPGGRAPRFPPATPPASR